MTRNRMTLLAGKVLACASAIVGPVAAQPPETAIAFPSRNITLVVPYGPGGPPDIVARLLATPLGDVIGRPVVVENRQGASTSLGATQVARAAPDGYTIMLTDLGVAVAPAIMASAKYDPVRDLAPVVLIGKSWLGLTVHPDVPAKSVAELIALSKARPGEIKFGTGGVGTPPHLVAIAFLQATGADLTHVPYRGVAQAINDAVGGHISVIFVSQSATSAQIAAGQLRLLGVSGPRRFPKAPDAPTFKELGIDLEDVEDGVWLGITAPAGTPAAIVDKLNGAVNKVLADPQVRPKFDAIDFTLSGGTSAELGHLLEKQTVFWRAKLKAAGIKAE